MSTLKFVCLFVFFIKIVAQRCPAPPPPPPPHPHLILFILVFENPRVGAIVSEIPVQPLPCLLYFYDKDQYHFLKMK